MFDIEATKQRLMDEEFIPPRYTQPLADKIAMAILMERVQRKLDKKYPILGNDNLLYGRRDR